MFYGLTGSTLSLPKRDRTAWDKMQALGPEFLGPQTPHGRRAYTQPYDVPLARRMRRRNIAETGTKLR